MPVFWRFALNQLLVIIVGNWLGLFYTPRNGCNPPGDGIADTPAESTFHFSCANPNRDSCPNDPGLDPMYNYMAISPDTCAKEFTKDQRLAMRAAWFIYRAPQPVPAPVPVPAPAPVPVKVPVVPVGVPVAVPVAAGMKMKMMMGG
jgi:Pregnancy-associated plasma protein-A